MTVELTRAHRNALEGVPMRPKIEEPLPLVLERPRYKLKERRFYSRNQMVPIRYKRSQFKSVSPRESIRDIRAPKQIKNSWSGRTRTLKKIESYVSRGPKKSSRGSNVSEAVNSIGIKLNSLQEKIISFTHKMSSLEEIKVSERDKELRKIQKRKLPE